MKDKTRPVQGPVPKFIRQLDPSLISLVAALWQMISADTRVGERVKWNSRFLLSRRHSIFWILTVGLPIGATVPDSTGCCKGTDGRRTTSFKDLDEVKSKAGALQQVIRTWIKQVV